MPFAQTPVNYAAEYSRALANQYPYLSYFGEIWAGENSTRFRPGMGKTVYIPSLEVSGARAVNRDYINGEFFRRWNNDFQPVELDMDREWDTLIDPMDVDETNQVASIANVTRAFQEQQKVPEMDAYMASKLAGFAGNFGGVDTTALTPQNILAQWDAYLADMKNQRVNRDRLVAYMTPGAYKNLKEAAGLTRFVDTGEGFRGVDRNIARLDGVNIREVPADMMMSAYDFTEGWSVAAGAQQINMIFVNPDSVAAPIKYEVAMMSPPTAQSKGKYLWYERYYYGAFILMQRQAGLLVNMATAPTLGVLTVSSEAGTVTAGDTIVTVTGNQIFSSGRVAYGLDLYYTTGSAAVSLTYGAALPAGSTWTKLTGNPATIAGQTAGNYITVALVNRQQQTVVAGGNTTMLVKA